MPDLSGVVDAPGVLDGRTDAQLAADSRHDATAFTALYARWAPRVFAFLVRRTGSREDAADLTQQVFLRCYQALPRYEERGIPVSAWIFQIARNVATDAHRRRKPSISWDRLDLADGSGTTARDVGFADSAIRRHDLDALLATLSPDRRELLALRFAADLSVREIAAVVGRREDAVAKQLRRTLHALKEAYDRDQT